MSITFLVGKPEGKT